MGWDGRPMGPLSGDELREHIDDELSWNDDQATREVVASALGRGAHYAAVRRTERAGASTNVHAVVTLYERRDGTLYLKSMHEEMGPFYWDAPAAVLDALDPTNNEGALKWRHACRQRLEAAAREAVRHG